jgi:hypothetical protein
MVTEKLFDAINDSQDGKPLRKFFRERQEDEVLMVGDAVSALIVSCIVESVDAEELYSKLGYALAEIQNARRVVFRSIDAEAPDEVRVSWESMQKKK